MRERERERRRERGRERERDRERERGREGGREGGRERGRERERENSSCLPRSNCSVLCLHRSFIPMLTSHNLYPYTLVFIDTHSWYLFMVSIGIHIRLRSFV